MFSKQEIERYYDLSEIHYRRFWDLERSRSLHYGYWDESVKNFHEALLNINKVLSRRVNIISDDNVFDAGCGIGGSSVWLAKNIGCKVTGASLSAKQVKKAADISIRENVSHLVTFMQTDFTNTSFNDNSFDVIWAIESVCHVANKTHFIKEAFRLLKKGGRLVIADFFKKENLKPTDAAMINSWARGWAVDDFSTKESFVQHLKEGGFSDIKFEDGTSAIMPSAQRLYRAYLLGFIPAFIYRLFNKATKFSINNVETANLQYKTLKNGSWVYGIVSAKKA